MARLIPRKQVEEVQDFIRDTSFAGNVSISGSLLVSQSFSFGNDVNVKSDMTGSIEITGSLTVDGPINVVGDQALDLTSSVSLESLDTQLFGGIRPEDFGANEATLYVSAVNGDDNNDGRTPQFPLKTIKKAAELATAGDDGRFGLPDSDFSGFRIEVAAGTYRENNPIELPRNTTVWGAGLRVSKIVALNENEDLFWVNSGCYLAEMTFAGLRVFPSVDNSRSGFAIAFAPNAFITTSPYIQNCSMISNQENSFKELYEDIPAGGGGLNVDGNRIHPDSPLASMVLDAYTQIAPNGVGCQVVGRGFIQLVSFFTNFSAYAVKVLQGGQAVLLNSNTSFGDFGMYASGSRFITGSGGNIEAFRTVRDNYSIIVDTIEDGLSAIPEFVPNTDRGVKVTDELQYFISGNSSDEVAEQAKSEYRLVSNIVESGISNIPSLLAKSATRGYNTGSVWNVSNGIQTTGSVSATSTELAIIEDNFSKVTETIFRGNRATASYDLVDNIDGLVRLTNETQYTGSDAATDNEVNLINTSFNTVLKIVEYGLNNEDRPIPPITSSTFNNIKVTETPQFITDISSSAEVSNKISSSFATVYRILELGSDYGPDIVQSSSLENPTIDYQNGYNVLLGNLSFIQEETIAYLSSSWSDFDYNQDTCKRDIGFIVSGAAHDLLYGGNEESVRSGNFYYLYPSEATASQKQQTLDAIKYAGGIAEKVVSDIVFTEPSVNTENAYDLLINNKPFIKEEVISFVSSSWRGFDYDEDKCKRDVGYIVDAVATDLRYGGNERSVTAGKFYYDYPSEATTTQLLPTLDGIEWARDLSKKLIVRDTFVSPSSINQSVYDLIVENRSLIQDETVNFIDTQFPNLVYLRDKCRRDTGYTLDAVATDLLYGGNQKSIRAGLYYGEVPSKVNTGQLNETIDGINYAKSFVDKIITNELVEVPGVVDNTKSRVQAGNIDFVTSSVSGTESERIKVSSSFGLVEDIIKKGEDSLLTAIAGNTPNFKWTIDEPKLVTNGTLTTSSADTSNIENIVSNYGIITDIITNGTDSTPSEVTTWNSATKVTDTTQYINTGSVASSTQANLVSESISLVSHVVKSGIKEFTPTTASYDPSNGDFVMTIPNHTLSTFDSIYLKPESFTFTCEMDDNKTEHNLPAAGQKAYTNRLPVTSTTTNTITVNVGASGPNIQFTPTDATYDPSTGDLVLTIGSHTLSVGEGIVLATGSLAFTCTMDGNDSVKSYPRLGIDPYAGRSMAITNTDSTTITVNVGAAGSNKYFTPTAVSYNASTGDMVVTTNVAHGLGVGRSVVLENESFAFTCDQDGNATTHSYPRLGSDPYAGKSIQITSVGYTSHTATDAPYNPSTGLVTLTIPSHGFSNGDYVKISDNSLTYTCVLDDNTEEKSYPRAGVDYPSGRWLSISNVTTNTFDINIGSSPYNGTHTFVSATANGVQRQDKTFTINVGDAGSASGAVHTFVSASTNAVKFEPQSVHTFVSASTNAVNHLPQSVHTFVRTISGSVTTLPVFSEHTNDVYLGDNNSVTSATIASSTEVSEVSSSFNIVLDIVEQGTGSYTPTNATYDPSNGEFVMTIPNHNLEADYGIYLRPESFTFTCDMDGNKTEHKLPASGQPAYNNRLSISSVTNNTVTVNVGASGPNVEFTPSNATYDPSTGDLVLTIGSHGLSVGEGIVLATGSIAFTCDMDDNQSVKSYPRLGIDPYAGRSMTITDVDTTTITVNVGAAGSNKYFTPSAASYNALSGDMEVTIGQHGLGVGRSIVLENESFAFTCDLDSNATTHSYPRLGSDPYAGKSISITSVGYTEHTVTDAPYNPTTGVVTLTIAGHGFSNGDYVKIADSSLTYTCVLDGNATEKSYPRAGFDYPSGRWLQISNVTTNTFDVNIGSSSYTGVHTFVSATSNGVQRQDGTLTFNVGDAGSASGSIHTFVSASTNAIKFEPQSAHTFVSASTYSVKHLPQSTHTFVRTDDNSVSVMPVLVENISENIRFTSDILQITSSAATASAEDVSFISSSFAIVTSIVTNGTGSLPTKSDYGSPLTSSNVVAAYNLLIDNISFIQDETIAYLSSSWSTASYDESKCRRDVGYIVSGAAEDLLHGVVSQSVVNGEFYYKQPSLAETVQLNQTIDGINYASRLSQKIVQNELFETASAERRAAWDLIDSNIDFIKDETILYLSSSWSTHDYNQDTCKRDVGFILDAVRTDIYYGGNERSIIAGEYYYLYPSNATIENDGDTGGELNQTLDGINYARRLAEKVIVSTTFTQPSQAILDAKDLLENNKQFIADEVVAFVSSSWSEVVYNETTCKRDTTYILDATITDLVYGGNERGRIAAEYYYRYPSSAVVGGVPSTTQQKDPTVDAIEYLGGISKKLVLGTEFTSADSTKLSIVNSVRENKAYIQQSVLDYINYRYAYLNYNQSKCYRDIGFITDAILTDLVYGGNQRSIQAGTFYYKFPSQATGYQLDETIVGINYGRDLTELIIRGAKQIEDSFDVVVKIIESGSSVQTDKTIGLAYNGLPISQVGTPKNSYGDNLITTTIGTILPDDVTEVLNVDGGIKFNDNTQYTSSAVTVSSDLRSEISESFRTVIDIIDYGISGSQQLSGSANSSSYLEVISLANDTEAFYFNQNQLQYFDGRNGWRLGGEDTGSYEGSIKDPTLTLVRNEMYNFSINDLGFEDTTIDRPFLIKTKRTEGTTFDVYESIGLVNNGITFGTITFTPLADTPDTLYYVNPNNVSASGVINIVDSLPLSDEQEFVYVPTKGEFEKVLNTAGNIKISTAAQYTSSLNASVSERNSISSSINIVVDVLESGSSVAPTLVKTIDGLIKRSDINQITSSLSGSSDTLSKISSSFAIVLDIIENGTGSLPTQTDNTTELIKVGDVSQFTTASISASIDDINFISESFEIVARMVEFGTGSYQTASLYGSRVTTPQTVAGYNLIKQNIDFIQTETIAYLSSSWSTFEYNEASCSRDIGYIVSGAAEDMIHNIYSASIVNGKFYYEFPSEATASQLNQTLDGIRYASRLAQNIASNKTFVTSSSDRLDTETIIRDNVNFIKEEAITFLSSSWSAFDYNETTCKRDIGYILDATITDIVYGGNERSINAGVFYYKYPSEATGSQLFPTLDGIQYAGEVAKEVVSGSIFSEPSSDKVNAYELVHQNRELIQDEVISYISASWNSFDYDDVKCRRDVGYILDAATTDFIYGGNERSVIAGDFYYRYPSQATGSQLNQTVDGIVYAQRLADKMLSNTLLVTASLERREVYDLIERNRELVQDEVISYISSSWVGFEYNQDKCHRDVGHILDAVSTDVLYGGNERSVIAGEYYWLYPSDATEGQKVETIDGIVHAANLVQKLVQNVVLTLPTADKLEVWNTIRNNRTLIQNETVEYIDYAFPFLNYNKTKCRRDVGHILDGVATDVLWGGNQRSVKSGDFYYRYPSLATNVQLDETIAGIRYAESLLKSIVNNITLESPSLVLNTDGNIKVTAFEPILSSIALSGSYQTEVSESIDSVTGIITSGVSSYTPTTAAYNPANGDFTMTIIRHGLSVGDSIYLKPESFTFTCEMDGNRTEHKLPSVGQPAYDSRLTIKSITTDTVTVNVGASGPNIEFNPTNATYDPATGDFVITVGEHDLSVGEGVVLTTGSFAFTCEMDNNQSVKSYPRFGIDQYSVRSLPITEVTDTTLTVNVGASGPNKYFTPVSASYNALNGDMTLTVSESFGLGVGRSVVLENESFAFTCDQNGDLTTHSYPRSGSDPYAEKSIVITSVGTTSHTPTDAPYNPSTGVVTLTIANHGFSNGDYVKVDDGALTYTCVSDNNQTEHSYPRAGYDYPSGRWLEISNVATNTFDINVGSSSYLGEHTFVSATTNGIKRQDGTFTINVGDAGSASGSIHTFVSASQNAVKHEPQSVHTFVSASNGAVKHLPQSTHTFVRTQRDSVTTLPVLTESIEGLIKINDIHQYTSSIDSGSEVESGYVTRSVGFINDIIRFGTDDIPFALAKWYDDTLDVPQNLTTGSYVTASGTYTTTTEFGIVSSSFGQIINIIENGTGSIPTLETNAVNNIKVTDTNQFTSSLSGSATEISKVNASVGIVENIVENGLSVKPTIVFNNSDKDNLIKVTEVAQITSESFGDRLQQRLISSSIGVVLDIVENGTGSLPTIEDYGTPSDAPKTIAAYNLLKLNIPFIQSETIAYLSSSWSNLDYNEASCSRDVGLIISGAAEDMLHNSLSASVVNGKFYYEYPSAAIISGSSSPNSGSQLVPTLDGIRYAGRMAENIVRGYTYVTSSVDVSGSVELIRNNKTFIQEETIAFISSSWSDFEYNQDTCKRDVGFILDAVATDLLYGGNERSVTAGDFYYRYPSAAIVGGVPSVSQQKDPTVTAIDFVQNVVTEIVSGNVFVTSSSKVEYVYDSLRLNREFIQNETIAFVNAKYPNLDYNEASCRRDTGFIVDAVATDLRWGGNQRSLTAGEFYYRFPSQATGYQLTETIDALIYARDLSEKIIDKETLFVPTGSLNTDSGIKVTNLSPATFQPLSDPDAMVEEVSASFAIVSDAILNGTGSTPTASLYGSPLVDDNIVRSYAMITASVPFIQSEVVEYISSSWVGFGYDDVKCARDVGFIVNGVAEDLLHGVVSASAVNAREYYKATKLSEATGSQRMQTFDGITYAYQLTEQILRGATFTNPTTEISASVALIRGNRHFIQSESIAYLSSSWEGFEYNQETCKRDVGYIVDAVATDLLYGGNQRSKIAGEFYYKFPSNATTSELEPTTTGIKYAGDVASKLVQNEVFVTASAERLAGNRVILDNKEFIQNEVIAYVSSSWSDFDYNEASCSRDVGYILNAVATDFLYGGTERSREAGEYYYLFPSQATTTQLVQTIDGINYAGTLARKVMENITFTTASAEVSASAELLRNNRSFIQNETIEFISSSWSNVVYNEDKCRRDTGYIVDAAATDLLYGGNERSATAGLFYWRYPSRATNAGTPSEQNQLDPTVDGIRFANGTAQNVVQNLEYTTPSTEVLNGIDLLRNNTTFIQKETIAYLSSSWSEFEYNEVSCSRDIGYIIDAVATDLKYGGNERAVQAGTFYYYIPSIATTEQKPQTTDGIDFAKGLTEKVIKQTQLVFPFLLNLNAANALVAAKKDLQAKAISYTNAAFPDFDYNEEKCYRDTGFIVDAIATDIKYGGNERSIRAAESYYTGVYGSAAVVVNEQKYETAETNRYLRTQFQFVARQAPTEEFGSLIITTGHDFSYAGSGVTYKALPPNQGGDGVPDPTKEIVEVAGGRVFFTSGNELGDFRIGAGLIIKQESGTLEGRTFSRSLFSLVTPFSLALQD